MASKQIKVTLSAGVQDVVSWLAGVWGKPESEIVMDGFERSRLEMIREAKEIKQAVGVPIPEPNQVQPNDLACEFIRALAEKRKPDVLTVQKLADSLGVPSESLAELVADCCCETEERKSRAKSQR